MIVALCGGVGGSKLVVGLDRTVPPGELSVIVNTADDLEFCGLHVSPDLDTVMYTLAGMAGPMGWGIAGDTFHSLEMLERFGVPGWFRVGDRDLATDIYRSAAMREGRSLTEVTRHLCERLRISSHILPMTDSRVATRLVSGADWIDFQEYFVHRRHKDPIQSVKYDGVDTSTITSDVLSAFEDAEAIIIVNSNPVLSILPMLAVPGINDMVSTASVPRVAVSPIVGSNAVSGPAGDLMHLVQQPASVLGVAGAYLGIIDGIVIDLQDAGQIPRIEALGLRVLCTDTIMRDEDDRNRLARETLSFARELS
ncbi:MAG: 2-phospho-L-lactate transferase [Chloroflexota bacterium]